MLRRLSCFALALAFAASSVFSSAAWSADSFISGGSEYEPSADVALSDDLPVPDVYAAPRRAPRMVKVSAADQAAADANATGKLVVPATLPSSVDGTFKIMSKYREYSKGSSNPYIPKIDSDFWRDVVYTCVPAPKLQYGYVYYIADHDLPYNPSISDPNDMVRGLAAFCDGVKVHPPGYISVDHTGSEVGQDSWSFTINYDVSSYASSAFSLDGIWSIIINSVAPGSSTWQAVLPLSVDVLVDGQQVLSLSRGSSNNIDFGGYVYSGSSNISIISFRWHMPFWVFLSDIQGAGTYSVELVSYVLVNAPNALTISFLDGQKVINAQNDKTKSDINKHEEYESQWTGSMTENFNALGFSDFSWSDSLVSGFSLFSGIFMDIWRALGGATILFTFPLLLGIALLLVGRISRSGGRSGSGKGGGDGG